MHPRAREAIVALFALVLMARQALLPGFIGMANQGDFGKVAGRLCIGGADDGAENFVYFEPDYLRQSRFCLVYGPPSSEGVFARAASWIERHFSDPSTFDIRWLGALHLAAWWAAYIVLIYALRPLRGAYWWAAAALSLWIFTDVNWVAYFNTFYTDVPALIGGLASMSAIACLGLSTESSIWPAALLWVAALLFVTSKSQHGAAGFLFVAPFVVLAWRVARPGRRWLYAAMAVSVLAADAWLIAQSPYWMTATTRFNVIFYNLLPGSANPARDAAELGLTREDVRYVGLHGFMSNSPTLDPAWMAAFARRSSYLALVKFYLRHPARVFEFLRSALTRQAPLIRAPNLSNYRKADGQPAGALADRQASWSRLRAILLAKWPWHIVVWYGLALLAAPWIAFRDIPLVCRAWLCAAMFSSLLGAAEFLIASLGDSLETYRHLALFHLFTDFSFLSAFAALLAGAGGRGKNLRQSMQPR